MLPANMFYYGNEDYYDALYKKTTFAQDHNLSVTGNNGKLNYYVSGRFYGYDGLFRYNTDNYKMMNLRGERFRTGVRLAEDREQYGFFQYGLP